MAGLPKVTIDYGNGALGQTLASADGLLCLVVCGATAVKDGFTLAKPYSVRKLSDLEGLGIYSPAESGETNNALLYNTVKDFYREAADGTQLYVVGYPASLSMADALDKDKSYVSQVIDELNGEIRGIVVTKVVAEEPDALKSGLDIDIESAMMNAQALGEWSATTRYAPIFTILDGVSFSGDAQELKDLKTYAYNRVGVVIGSTKAGSANQAIGLVAGRIATASVENNIGRVADGALRSLEMYAGDQLIELADVESIYNKSYITFRTFTGISGYFIADDLLATKATDDYNQLTRRRIIDKAYRLAYVVMLEKLLDKIAVKSDGTMLQHVIVSWQQDVENVIARNMTANGELSADVSDANDRGVECYIDPAQDVLASSEVRVELRVRPYGYARYINVLLGFTINEQ